MKRPILRVASLSFPFASAIAAALLAGQSAQAQNLYWDGNNGTSGFGSASGTWAAPTTGTATAGWSASSTGVVVVAANSVTTTSANTLNFGTDAATFGLAAGTITVTGMVDAASLRFGSQTTGNVTLAGGNINLGAASSIHVGASGTTVHTISSSITGAATSLTKTGNALTLSGTNSYSGPTLITAGRLQFATLGSFYNNVEANWTAANIDVNSGATLAFNVGGTNQFTLGNVTTLLTNLAASSSATTGMNAGSNLGFDTTTATNGLFTIADVIADSTGASGGARGLTKLGTGTLVLTNANTYTGTTAVSGGTLHLATVSPFSSTGGLTMSGTTLISDRSPSGAGVTHTFANASIGNGTNTFMAGPNVTDGTAAIQLAGMTNDNGTPASPGLNPTTANLIITGGVNLGSGANAGISNFTLGGTGSVNSIGGAIINGARVTANLIKSGTSAWTLSGANTFNGTTAVNGGLLSLDYTSQDNSKLSDTGALTLGNATLNLSGGSHPETVLSTTLTANTASRVTRSSGTGILQMNLIAPGALATIDFGAAGIATTDTTNTNGILGAWATIAGTDFAANSGGLDGLITAPVYTDVTRLASGSKVVADGSATNIRIVEGTGGAASITLGAATTTINTLNHSISGGTGAGTIDSGTQILRTNAILIGPAAGALTIGNGTLSTATAGGDLRLINNSANGITINSVIADNTTASTLIKQGTGTVTLGTANTYTGTTTVNQGTLTVGPTGTLGSTTAALAANNDNIFGAGTNTVLNLTSGGNTTVGTLTSVISPPVSGTNTVTINTGGAGLDFIVNQSAAATYPGVIAGAGNFTFNGSATNTLALSGANTYTGATAIGTTGTLILSNVSALGGNTPGVNATSGISMATGTLLRSTVSGVTVSAPITTTGSVTFGAPSNNAGQVFSELILNGVIGGAGTTNVNFDSFLNSNSIQTVTLGATNTYSGNTTIGATQPGTASQIFVKLGINDALPTTTVLNLSGGTGAGTGRGIGLNLFGFNQTLAGLTNTAASLRVQEIVNSDVSAAATLTINSATPTAYSGSLGSPTARFSVSSLTMPGSTNGNNFGLTKTGASTFTLSGTNTYSGATVVSQGTLIINGNNSGATGAITVAAGATLGGTGTLGGTLTVNGTFAPGTSPGTMTTSGPVIFNAGSVLNYELVGNDFTVGGAVNDLLTGVSNLTLGGTLNVTEIGVGSFAGAVEGNTWRLMNYTGTLAGTLALGTTPGLSGGRSFEVNTGTVGQINLVVVPEPTTTVTLLASLGLLLGRRRRA